MSACHVLVCTGALLLLVAAACVLVAVGHALLRTTPCDTSTVETFSTDDGSTPGFFQTLENEVDEHIAKPVEAAADKVATAFENDVAKPVEAAAQKVEAAIETDVIDPVKQAWDSLTGEEDDAGSDREADTSAEAEAEAGTDTDSTTTAPSCASFDAVQIGYAYMPETEWELPQRRPPVCLPQNDPYILPLYTSGYPSNAVQWHSKPPTPPSADVVCPIKAHPRSSHVQRFYKGHAAAVPAKTPMQCKTTGGYSA